MTTSAPASHDVTSTPASAHPDRRPQQRRQAQKRVSRCAGAFLIVLMVLLLVHTPAGQPSIAQGAPFSGTSYYVDCADGNDGNSGTSEGTAWRSLAKAGSASLAPGDALLLKRGCRWSAPLNVPWRGEAARPVTVSVYGSGLAPIIHSATNGVDDVVVTGQYVVVEYLHTTATAPRRESGCQDNPVGQISGVKLKGGAAYNTLRYLTATDLAEGVTIEYGSHHNTITNSLFRNNTMMVKLDPNAFDSYGAHGVNVHGDDNEVSYNEFSGHIACSYHHGTDGSAVEIYGGQRNRVHHNVATDNETFVELGDARTADTTFSYNLIRSVLRNASFIVTRGASDYYGPVARSRAYNNTIFLSGANATAIRCFNV